MKLSDFDFDLPEGRIATRPVRPRSAARLLVAEGSKPKITDAQVSDLPRWLKPGDRLVLNDTKVIPAQLSGVRRRQGAEGATEARIEATLLAPLGGTRWHALLKPLKKVRDGEAIDFGAGLCAVVEGRDAGTAVLDFRSAGDFDDALAAAGRMPLPPYIAAQRPADAQDRDDYQSIWAARPGAVAAPTASLHFDDPLLASLAAKGIDITHVTLHVGAGTFLPVKVDDIAEHKMHAERGEVSDTAAAEIHATRRAGGRIVPVGTTALRLIETAATAPGVIAPWKGVTDIFITPGFRFQLAHGLMTNFHLPRSTLMMLVSAFLGVDQIRRVYDHAIAADYRFFSYGDASLLLPGA